MTDARQVVLARIRAALGPDPVAPAVPRDYRRTGDHPAGSPELLDLLTDRLVDYKATVVPTTAATLPADLRAAVAATLPPGGRLIVPPGLPPTWDLDAVPDDGTLTPRDLDTFAGVVTACAAACAETGTIALDGAPDQGRRAISLVPDRHFCVVRADQVVHTVPDLLARLAPTRPLTLISGPSATSDIELDRVEGVHGPRTLVVLLVR
ncbi:LUD domain-containing protein [Dactylosporangium aurantiacum]|uniref:LUD domain-containing protein n=1 Tax=Dactylosporangium aurantiacum TaxID=35754 RepID=A0A9Q9IGS0_9ACTN|nr:LUD domain-containing protein [Dactylosporangium aurantiacum]MDG6102643.1 LUD domain-containing protein [Dactylosporangium aurantiacum]UWZ53104.1 LUD domain-containing protein [Dactylosporangium aurantiacum]